MTLTEILPTRAQNNSYLQKVWEHEQIQSFKDFFRCYHDEDVVPTLEAMRKMVEFRHSKRIHMLNLEGTLSSKGRGVAAFFDSQTENFLRQKGQSTKPSGTDFC